MKDKWLPPGKLTEPAGTQLGAFGIKSIPGARLNMVDPSDLRKMDLWGQLVPEGEKRQDIPRRGGPPTVEGMSPTVRNPHSEESRQDPEQQAEAKRKDRKKEQERERKNQEQSL